MNAEQLKKVMDDPVAFRNALIVDTDAGPRRLGSVLAPFQDKDFRELDPAWLKIAGRSSAPCRLRAWIERGRSSSKTSDIATMVCYLLLSTKKHIAGYVCAADRDQAGLIRSAVMRLASLNKWLADCIEIQNWRIIDNRTKSVITILSSDAPSAMGLLPDLVICDELVWWPSESTWHAMFSSAAKKTCLLICITNSGFLDSWVGKLRESVRSDSAWYFSSLSGASPFVKPETLEEQRRLLPPMVFARYWLNQWSSGSERGIHPEDIERSIVLDGPTLVREEGKQYFGAVDLAIHKDNSAFVTVSKETGWSEVRDIERPRYSGIYESLHDLYPHEFPKAAETEEIFHPGDGLIRLCNVQIWRPTTERKVKVSMVRDAILRAHEVYGYTSIALDPHQAELLHEELLKEGLPVFMLPFVANNLLGMAQATLDAFQESQIQLYRDETLIDELLKLEIQERQFGYRLVSPRSKLAGGGHGDAACCLSMCLLAAKLIQQVAPVEYRGEIITYP